MANSDVNWSQCDDSHPMTILPEYSSGKRSCWIPSKQPLSSLPSSLSVDLDKCEWSHIKDHVINGEIIVPSATSLRIIDQHYPGQTIASVDFLIPIMASSSKINFTEKEDKGMKVLVVNGMDVVAYSIKNESTNKPTVSPFETPRKQYGTKEVYERFFMGASMYQKRFQVISTIGVLPGRGTAVLDHVDRIDILIDGALQAIVLGYLLEQPADHYAWLPFNVEKVKIHKSQYSGRIFLFFTHVNNGAFLNGDVSAFDEDGNILIDVKNVCFKRKETKGRATVPITVLTKAIPSVNTSERNKAKNYLLKWFYDSFGWNELDENANFFDFGLSSLQAVRLRNYLREEYPVVSTTSVFDHPSVLDLSYYLASLIADSNGKEIAENKKKSIIQKSPILPPSRLFLSPVGVRSAACRLPGGVNDPLEFWQLLLTGKNPSCRTPANRISSRNVLIKGQKYGSSVEGGNFIQQDVAAFDSSFFKISKSEAEMMDPQQRLLLECVEECIENSADMDMTEVGVFIGLMEKEYTDLMEQQQTTILSMLGSMVAVIAGRINYIFGSYGPSVTVDTACSSSLVAVEMAVNALLDGRCQRAIVAGVNLILSEKGQGHRSNGKMLSQHGMSLSFDARASGYGRSDGCVVLMLEKTKPTVEYLSILKGVNVNHGGRSVSLTAPNGMAHHLLLNSLFQFTPGVQAAVWEAHGTGTPLGDPIEVNVLSSLLQDSVVSSTKASIGHGEASAGTCGLLKLSMTLKQDYVPALLHFHVLNKDIQPGSLRLPVVGEEKNFDVGGISSFGVSGTNAAILTEKIFSSTSSLHSFYLIPVSAKNNNSLADFKQSISNFITHSMESLPDICGALCSRTQYLKRNCLLVSRERDIQVIENEIRKPEFCLFSDELEFDILAIEKISNYFKYLDRFNLSSTNKLLLSLVKFLQHTIGSFKWLSTTAKSQALILLASEDINEKNLQLFEKPGAVDFKPMKTDNTTISIGGTITDLQSLLKVIGELFVSEMNIDWSFLYSPPAKFIQLPTYPFNRQSMWFIERKPVYDHQLLGIISEKTDNLIEFENQLSPIRHPAIFKYGFRIEEAVLCAIEAGRLVINSSFKLYGMNVNLKKLEQATWLIITVTRKGDRWEVQGNLGGSHVFNCQLEKTSFKSTYSFPKLQTRGRTLSIGAIPSSIIREDDQMLKIEAVYDCPFRVLFHLLKTSFSMDNLEVIYHLPLEKKFNIIKRNGIVLIGGEKGVNLEINPIGVVRKQPFNLVQESIIMKTKEELKKDETVETRKVIEKKVREALSDVMTEEIIDGDEKGFMEMGMDSLTLVDFVNRLNDKYFFEMEISTTEIFDHPSVMELVDYLYEAQNPKEKISVEKIITAEHRDVDEVRNKIKQALLDVLPEEPTEETQGFLEMGMDSLILVDFVNRLNEKYFPGLEISTTEIFDHPNLDELSTHLKGIFRNGIPFQEKIQTIVKKQESVVESNPQTEMKIISALADVLPEEVEDYSIGFMEMGMDSLTLVDFVNRLSEKYFPGLEISTTDVFDNPTVEQLVNCLRQKTRSDKRKLTDSGIQSSEETSRDEETLMDAYFIITDNEEEAVDYKLIAKKGNLLIVDGKKEHFMSKETVSQLKRNGYLSIELEDGHISPEKLFLSLIDLCKLLSSQKVPLNITVPTLHNSSQYMARAFVKTAAAEKEDIIRYKWSEQLQRKEIMEEELQGKLTGVWLITGGLSGIGFSTAKWLAEEGVDGLVLVSRRIPDSQLEKELKDMEKKTKITVINADITDKVKMETELKKLKIIDGVIHCAGILQDGKMERQNSTSFKKVFSPKGDGYDILDQCLQELNFSPDTFIAMSSFTSVCGNVGQLNYGVANAYLDYKMTERRKKGKMGTSIHWGNWLETGMAANKKIHKILSEYGFIGFSTKEGLKYLKYAILKKPERFIAARLNWKIILEKRPDLRRDLIKEGFYEEKDKELEVIKIEDIEDKEGELDRVKEIRQDLLEVVQGLVKQKVKTNQSIMEMGLTPLILTALLERIKEKYRVKLTVAAFYKHSSFNDLAEHLAEFCEQSIQGELKEPEIYCDALALNIFYDDKEDLEAQKTGKKTIKRKGKYLQQVQGKTLDEIKTAVSALQYQEKPVEKKEKLVMMFSGQGAQYLLMGSQLAESFVEFKRVYHSCLEKCDVFLQGYYSLLDIVTKPKNYRLLHLTSHMQPIMFSFCYALGHLWKSLGVQPDFYLGHSVGELVAGVHAGIMTIDEGIRLIVARAKAMEQINGRGAMLAVDSRAREDVLAKFDVSIAAINSPKQFVIVGKKKILDTVLSYVKDRQLQATFVNTMYPFHSSLIQEEDLADFRLVLKTIQFKKAQTPIVSNVTGEIIYEFSEHYLVKHTVSAIQFVNCVNNLVKKGVKIWLEAGPSATLWQFLKKIIDPKNHLFLQSVQDKSDDCSKFIETALVLTKHGITIDWDKIYLQKEDKEKERLISLPIIRRIKISEEEAIVVMDHEVNKKIIVPGMYQVFSLAEAANRTSNTDFFILTNVRLISPWIFEQSSEGELVHYHDNRLSINVNNIKTCKANLNLVKSWKQKIFKKSFEDCNVPLEVEKWYEESGKQGLRYGPSFQVLKSGRLGNKKVIAKGIVQKSTFLWPLMDGALHLICFAIQHRPKNEYYVPVSVNEVFLETNIELKQGSKATFMTELVAENEKFIQFNSTLIIDEKLIFEARNAMAVIFKSDEKIQEIKQQKFLQPMQRESVLDIPKNIVPNEKKLPSTSSNSTQDIVVVGSAGSFCFSGVDLPSLWQQLLLGVSSHNYSYRNPVIDTDVAYMDQDITHWDPEFFGISPKEASYIDPMQRLLMVMVYRALESAAFPCFPSNTGVYVGQSGLEFIQLVYKNREKQLASFLSTGTHGSCLAGRISHWLKLEGPSLVVDTACSSSFMALSLAVQAISRGQIDMAIVAGAHLILHDVVTQVLKNGGMINDHCKSFDASADGYRRSEGIGVVLLASKSYALKNHLSSQATILSWYSGHNGSSGAMSVPNGKSQEECMRHSGGFVEEVELHATGTPLGDPIESAACLRLGPSRMSSIKSHLGHAEGAAGIASLLATLLQFQHGYRLPQLHFCCPNQKIPNLSTRIIGEEVDFDRIRINNFGFSGSNVSIVVEKSPQKENEAIIRRNYLIPLSAKTKESVKDMTKEVLEVIKHSNLSLSSITGFYQCQPQYQYRKALLVDYKRRIVQHKPTEKTAKQQVNKELVRFLYGDGVATTDGDLASRIKKVCQFAGIPSPDNVCSPLAFYQHLANEYEKGTTINWKAIDNLPPAINCKLSNYHFNNRRYWLFDEKNERQQLKEKMKEGIYFEKVMIEKELQGRKVDRNIHTVSKELTSIPYVSVTDLNDLKNTTIIFHAFKNSYSEAAFICNIWNTLELTQNNTIVVICKTDVTSHTEWTALLRSLAAEKPNKYMFISYEQEHQIKEEIYRGKLFEAVHYKDGKRFVERLIKTELKEIKRGVNHLVISGGNGGIGKKIIEYLQPGTVTNISRSTGYDLSVEGVKLPLTLRPDMVIHAAGIVDNVLLSHQTYEKFKNVGDIKVNGLKTLSLIPGDFLIVLLSSTATIFGSLGQANYAFANGKMISTAEKSGRKFRVVHYGPWNEVGMLSGNHLSQIRKQIENRGWSFLDPDTAVKAIENQQSILVFDGDFNTILQKNPHLASLLELIAQPTYQKLTQDEIKSIADLIVEISGITNIYQEKDTPLMQLGLDSLMLEELRIKINNALDVKLSSAELYDNCSLSMLEKLVTLKTSRQSESEELKKKEDQLIDDRVAIIGASASFSGSSNIEEFWNNLMNGKESIERKKSLSGYVSAAGIIPDIDKFDHKFFKITKEEADGLDPQIRSFIQHAYHALESSGYIEQRSILKIGIYAGAEPSNYSNGDEEPKGSLQQMFRSNMKDFLATMAAHALDLKGPAVGVYSACSTSLVALQQGMNAIRLGQIDLAIIGGVSLVWSGEETYEFQKGMVLSETGFCRPFDQSADGTVRGSVVGCLVLKSLNRAMKDEDTILSVIHALGTSNDGAIKASFMAPNTAGQTACIEEALKQLKPGEMERITYIECHGTGTLVGDEIELRAIKKVYNRPIVLGSVKANIGHGFAGAGMASIIKAIKILETGWIPPQINFKKAIEAGESFIFPTEAIQIKKGSLIAVSSFGIGGTNGHVILGSSPIMKNQAVSIRKSTIYSLSAKTGASLQKGVKQLEHYLSHQPDRRESAAFSLQTQRETYLHRTAIIQTDEGFLKTRELQAFDNLSPENIAIFFSPQGVQYPGVEKSLLSQDVIFMKKLKELCSLALTITGIDFEKVMYPLKEEEINLIMRPDLAQVATFLINMATIHQLNEWGIDGKHLLGHSVGEYSAFVHAGVLSEINAIKLLYNRGKLCQKTETAYMIAVRGELPDLSEELEISAILSDNFHCIVGPLKAIEKFKKDLEQRGNEYREIKTERGFHSYMLDQILDEFEELCERFHYNLPQKTIISGTTGHSLHRISPKYLRDHMRRPVNLKSSLQTLFSNTNIRVIIEVGPAGILQSLIREDYPEIVHVPTVPSKKNTSKMNLWNCLAEMWCLNYSIDWRKIYGKTKGDPYCPGYPFEKISCWREKIVAMRHNFYSLSWIPIQWSKQKNNSKCLLISKQKKSLSPSINQIHAEDLKKWKNAIDTIVYIPHELNQKVFFEVQQLLSESLRLNVSRFLVINTESYFDWLALGPIREFQLLHNSPICQFIDNSDGLNIEEIVERTQDTKEDFLRLTRDGLFKIGYSELITEDERTTLQGVVIIFGGTGTLGSTYVTVLKEISTVEKIIVIGRRSSPLMKGIQYVKGDVTSSEDVKSILSSIQQQYGRIDVVINLAGVATTNSLDKKVDDITSVFSPKVLGTLNILCYFEEVKTPLPLLILSSSLSSYITFQGNSDYAAANLFLDGLALKGHPYVRRVQSIQWPLWKEGRMAEEASSTAIQLMNRGALSQAQGMKAIRESFGHAGCLAYYLIHPTKLKQLVRKQQLESVLIEQPRTKNRMELVRQEWTECLGCEINQECNFFDLGGNSLNALRLIWQLNKLLRLQLTINYVFQHPIFKDFYNNLPKPKESEENLKLDILSPLPLSYSQENMFLLRILEPGPQYNIIFIIEFHQEFDYKPMTTAIRRLIARQLGLRMVFKKTKEQFSQEVCSLTESFHALDVKEMTEDEYEKLLEKEKKIIFDFETSPLRIRWIFTSTGYKLLFNQHHIITDGWSMTILAKELSQMYKDTRKGIDTIPLSDNLALFAMKDRRKLFSKEIDELKKKHASLEKTSLVKDIKREEKGFEKIIKYLPEKLVLRIQQMARKCKTTEFIVCLSGYLLTLRQWKEETEEDGMVVGIPVSGRNEQSENLIGYFLNNILLSINISRSSSIVDIIPLVESKFFEAREMEQVPFHHLVAELKKERVPGQHPLFQMYFNYRHSLDYPRVVIDGHECRVRQVSMNTLFDLSTTIDETPDGLRIMVEYNAKIFEKETIEMFMTDMFKNFLGKKHEKRLCGKRVDVPRNLKIRMRIFRKQSYDFTDIAYTIEQEFLQCFGYAIRPDTVVILEMISNSIAQIAPILQKSGLAYAPVDLTWPEERKEVIRKNLSHSLWLTETIFNRIINGKRKEWNRNHPTDLAYVIHTSGSTGIPKGVAVTCKNLNTFLHHLTRQLLLSHRSRVYHSVNTVFDVSIANIFGAAVNGSTFVLHDNLMDQMGESSDSSHLFLTSAVFNSLSEKQIDKLQRVEKLFIGGETIHEKNLLMALKRGIDVTQIYGPTETTIWSLTNRCKMEKDVERIVGVPIVNETARILYGCPVGELELVGDKISRGYLHQEVFGGRYLTKDLIRLKGGRFYFLGRLDDQVKIRGNRVELREVEKYLLNISKAKTVVVLKHKESLIAFLVDPLESKELGTKLACLLPAYSIPSNFVSVDCIPKTTSDKVDKMALLQEFHKQIKTTPNNIPREEEDILNSIEEKMINIFKGVLKKDIIRKEETIFNLGGHSLLFLTLQQKIEEEFQIEIPVADLFSNPTVEKASFLVIEKLKSSPTAFDTSIITKMRQASKPIFNIYLIHAVGGAIFPYYAFLQIFPKDVSVYAIEYQLEYEAKTLKELAALYAKAVAAHTKNIRPFLLGHSMGGTISREMIPDLKMWGWEIPFVVMFDSWVLRSDQLNVEKIREFMKEVFAPLPNSENRVAKAVKLAIMLKTHQVKKSKTKIFLFKSKELGMAAFREAVRPDLNEDLSRSLIANGFDRVSHLPVTTWMINGDHESCLKVENLKTRQKEILSIFNAFL